MQHSKNHVRIIAGRWRGRKLSFPPLSAATELRPSGDRIRETLFNWLAPTLVEAHCLDAFAGSGILGWEALSRGAAHCSFIERANTAHTNLLQQQQQLDAKQCSAIYLEDTLKWLNKTATKSFDLVFLDPPFKHPDWPQQCIDLLIKHHWLHQDALVYIEQNINAPFPSHSLLESYRHKQAGQVQYALVKYLG